MTFSEWFDVLRKGEAKQPHVSRLSVETGLSLGTIYRAIKGEPVHEVTARVLSSATGGVVSVETIRAGRRASPPSADASGPHEQQTAEPADNAA